MKRTVLASLLFSAFLSVDALAQTAFPSLSATGNAGAIRIGNVDNVQAQVTPGAANVTATLNLENTTQHPDGWGLLTFLTGSATSTYGTLSGKMSALAEDKPEDRTTPLGSTIVNRTSCRVNGFLSPRFNDSAVVTSSTLPIGAPVTLTITLSLDMLAVGTSSPAPMGFATPPYGMNAIGNFHILGSNIRNFFRGITTYTIATQVGATFQFSGWLDLTAEASAGWDIAAGAFYSKTEASVDASRTAHFFIDPPPGVSLQTGSGHNYASASVPTAAGRLVNLSTRALAGTGANVLTAGFVLAPGADNQVLIRAVGPALANFGLTGVLADPVLSLFNSSNTLIATNDNWTAASAAAMATAGAFPLTPGSLDAAIVTTLGPGSYTAQITGANSTTGLALVEVYELTATGARLINISTRAQVGTGANVVIPGFVLSGSGTRRLLVRAVGPGLSAFGLSGLLVDPVLSLTNSAGTTTFATNDNWGTAVGGGASAATLASAFTAAGAFALTSGSADAAVLAELAPGNYTIQVSGANNTSGIALVEIYDVTGVTISTSASGTVSGTAMTATDATQL
jgi:hypothetical protein